MDENLDNSPGEQPEETPLLPGATQPPTGGDVEQEARAVSAEGPAGEPGDQPEPESGGPTPAADETGGRMRGPRVEIGIAEGDLRIIGGAVHVTLHQRRNRHAEPNAPLDRDGTLYFARVADGAELQVPDDVVVELREVRGDLSVQAVNGQLEVGRAGSDVTIDGIVAVRVATARSDVSIVNADEVLLREVGGDVEITSVTRLALDGRARSNLSAHEVEQVEVRGSVGCDVEIERCGNVALQGAIGGDLTITQCAGRLSVGTVSGDVTLTQVREARLGTVGSDLEVRGCLGAVEGTSVGSDATFTEVGSVRLTTVGSDLEAQRVGGPIEARAIGGDATLSRVGGRIAISVVGSDLEIVDAARGVNVERVGGDADIDTALEGSAEYSVSAGGDVTLRVRGEVNARFVAQAGGEVSTTLPLSVERGRRRHLVGVLGRGEAVVTLRSSGDIRIVAADKSARRATMSDEREGQGPSDDTTGTGDQGHGASGARTWEGSFGGRRFRLRWEQGPGRAGMHFQGPIDEDDPDAVGGPYNRAFGFEWERGRGARTYGEYEERLRDLGDKAERVARKAAEQAQELAEEAARKTRETDWEAVGREVRGAIGKAMSELEDAFARVRSEWERPGPGGTSGAGMGQRPGSTAQRVRIEQEDEQASSGASQPGTASPGTSQPSYGQPGGSPTYGASSNYSSSTQYTDPGGYGASGSYYGSGDQPAAGESAPMDREAQRRQILEQLRSGQLSLDEAERRLNELR